MRILRVVLVLVALVSSLLVGATSASASGGGNYTCSGGTLKPLHPAIIPPGTYNSITVTGKCLIPGGTVRVRGNVAIEHGAVLVVNVPGGGGMPEDDATLLVGGNVTAGQGSGFILGCAPSFGCANTTHSVIKGNLEAVGADGMLLHGDTIMGNLSVIGGGRKNYDCAPPSTGLFGAFGSPVYTTFEDGSIGGDASFSEYRSCWLGFARVTVGGNLTYNRNILGDPDAIEILASTVNGNLACWGNQFVDVSKSPPVYTMHRPWDSADLSQTGSLYPRQPEPNTVHGTRSGQCVLNSPTSPSDKPGPGPF
jgi:hypothetical protein